MSEFIDYSLLKEITEISEMNNFLDENKGIHTDQLKGEILEEFKKISSKTKTCKTCKLIYFTQFFSKRSNICKKCVSDKIKKEYKEKLGKLVKCVCGLDYVFSRSNYNEHLLTPEHIKCKNKKIVKEVKNIKTKEEKEIEKKKILEEKEKKRLNDFCNDI